MRSYYRVAPLMVVLSIAQSCGRDISSPSPNVGYNNNNAPTLIFTPKCDASCTPTIIHEPSPSPGPSPNPNPNPQPNPQPTADMGLTIDALIDAEIIDASWDNLCLAYGFPGASKPVCRRHDGNEINEGGILGCDPTGAPCCINPDAPYTTNLPQNYCTSRNWAPGFPKSVPESKIGQCVKLETVVRNTCQAYVSDAENMITAIDNGTPSCDDLGGPCCYAPAPPNTTIIPPTCLPPNQVPFVNESEL